MLSNKPYLIRAFFEWIVDNAFTPILSIDPRHPRCRVPADFLNNEEISFNISSEAVRDLKLGNERIEFSASFSGVVHLINIPVKAVLAIYAHENNEGMYFDYEEFDEDVHEPNVSISSNESKKSKKVSHLQLVE